MLALDMSNANKQTSSHTKLQSVWKKKHKELGLTQALAAEKMGFSSQSSVSQYLLGKIPLNLSAAIAFARLLEVPLADIWDGEDPATAITKIDLSDIRDLCLSLPYEEQMELVRVMLKEAAILTKREE